MNLRFSKRRLDHAGVRVASESGPALVLVLRSLLSPLGPVARRENTREEDVLAQGQLRRELSAEDCIELLVPLPAAARGVTETWKSAFKESETRVEEKK